MSILAFRRGVCLNVEEKEDSRAAREGDRGITTCGDLGATEGGLGGGMGRPTSWRHGAETRIYRVGRSIAPRQ